MSDCNLTFRPPTIRRDRTYPIPYGFTPQNLTLPNQPPLPSTIPEIPQPQQINLTILQKNIQRPTIQIRNVIFPSFPPFYIEPYQEENIRPPMPTIPQPLSVPDEIPEPDFNQLKKQLNHFVFLTYPYEIQFPSLPFFDDILIPDFDLQEFDLQEPEFEFLEGILLNIPRLTDQIPNFYSPKSYLANFGYVNQYVEDLYKAERYFFKKLFDFAYSLDTTSLSILLLEIENYLQREKLDFFVHLSRKQILLLRSIIAYKFGRERLKFTLNKFKTLLELNALDLAKVVETNKALFNVWQNQTAINFEEFKNYLKTIQRNSSLYSQATQINKNILGLFDYYLQLLLTAIEGQVLNIERDRLILDNQLAFLNFTIANMRQQLPNVRREVILTLDEAYRDRISFLSEKYQFLLEKRNFIQNDEYNILNQQLGISKTKLEINRDDANIKIRETFIKSSLQMTEEILSYYRQIWNDYMFILNKWEQAVKLQTQATGRVDVLINLNNYYHWYINFIDTKIEDLKNMYEQYMNYHVQSAQVLANANIVSEIIESYN